MSFFKTFSTIPFSSFYPSDRCVFIIKISSITC